jgi:Ni2+-binding GTPase involved in maturation of urease and hydrogenase
MNRARIIIVGGFLGAGKTTLLYAAATHLARAGKRVGLITNDQAPELVDTVFLQKTGSAVREVSGSCFCCNFPGLAQAITALTVESGAELILAEPVGSCTDLSATILQPLKDQRAGEIALAPLSVLVDPERLSSIISGQSAGLHSSSAYIFRKQLEEADFIVIAKADQYASAERDAVCQRVKSAYPQAQIFVVSAQDGTGIAAWLDAVQRPAPAGQRLAEVDYDIYAEGEAVLGWFNATYALTHAVGCDWAHFAQHLLSRFNRRFSAQGIAVGHVKLAIAAGDGLVVANLVGTCERLAAYSGAAVGQAATLTLNARVQMLPSELEGAVKEVLADVCGSTCQATAKAFACLRPGRPNPTYQYTRVV